MLPRHHETRAPLVLPLLLALLALGVIGCGSGNGPAPGGPSTTASPLSDPSSPEMTATPPDSFRVIFETTEGEFIVAVRSAQAPLGAKRFYNLVRHGFFDGSHFFRVLPGFVVQFGIHRDPVIAGEWFDATIADDPVVGSNVRGTLTFGTAGPNTRTTQLFINLADNPRLDGLGFSPIAQVIEGMDVVGRLYGGYGEGAPQGSGPDQMRIQRDGSSYLESNFPLLDRIDRARILETAP